MDHPHYLVYRLDKYERETHCAELRMNSNSWDALCVKARRSKFRIQVEHNDGAAWALELTSCPACRAKLMLRKTAQSAAMVGAMKGTDTLPPAPERHPATDPVYDEQRGNPMPDELSERRSRRK